MKRMPVAVASPMISSQIDDGICVLTFDRPESGANIFDAPTLGELDEHLDAIEGDSSVRGVIVASAKKSIFIAGADLQTLLRQAQSGELRAFIANGQRIFNRLAGLKIPTVAAIHGACAGGGYEIVLACDYRIASNDRATRIGLPETTLGLVPAWGGCSRLPRLIGLEAASEVILKGKLHSTDEALKIGLVDEVVGREQLLDVARKKIETGKPSRPSPPHIGTQVKPPNVLGNTAPARAFEIVSRALNRPIEESLKHELDAIVELGASESTQNLIRNFFLAEKYKKGLGKTLLKKVMHAAVIGAGVMGSGIAQWLSSRGVSVILRDVSREFCDGGLANIEKTYADAVKRGLMTEEAARQGRARIIASTAQTEMRDVEIVIEAASEKMSIKKQIFCELSEKAPNAILATNTSALSIDDLACEAGSPARVIGLHFFNPVSRMKLIEVVVGRNTSDETRDGALAFARQIGKLPVVIRNSPGFLVNRVLFPYLLDAAELFQKSVPADKIDNSLLQWGMPMGPLRLIDEIGVDITIDIADTLAKAYGRRDESPKILREIQSAGMLGRKSGSGFYKYEGKQQLPNEMIERWRTAKAATDADLPNRLVFLMVNEAARCLEEEVIDSPEDADFGMILGTGFAPFRGGPLRFAEHFGIAKVVQEMNRLAQIDEKFAPCELLQKHARAGTRFYE
jgi:3-hydroxyacyl-CoA dehydrogenase/enoyl-CoA hydratase/3-hydroxybutyryl-CoA epimerase